MPAENMLQTKIQKEIGDLTSSIGGLIDSFRELRSPLVKSHEQVPLATNQLDKVSEQTEAAAHKMLDMIESILEREEDVMKDLGEIKELAEGKNAAKIEELATKSIENAQSNLNDAFAVMDALQFQDITSQQMNHAASILEEVESRLDKILSVVGHKPNQNGEVQTKVKRERAFDPHADMNSKQTEQSAIDSLFAEKSNK